jgi:hypothetical protein
VNPGCQVNDSRQSISVQFLAMRVEFVEGYQGALEALFKRLELDRHLPRIHTFCSPNPNTDTFDANLTAILPDVSG